MKGYDCESKSKRPPPKIRSTQIKESRSRKRKRSSDETEVPVENKPFVEDETLLKENAKLDYVDSVFPANTDHEASFLVESATQTEWLSQVKEKRKYFIDQATCSKNCYRYTGVTRSKLDLVFEFLEPKATEIRLWIGSKNTKKSPKKRAADIQEQRKNDGVLTRWEQLVLTLVRIRKGFDVKFLAGTFGINSSQVSRIYTTCITFLSQELSFLVLWLSRSELQKCLPKRLKKFKNVRVIIDCLELFTQKPKVPSSQKITWSNYKHWNTAKLLVGITPTGVVSFIPPLWTESICDKEIVRQSGLLDLLEEGDAVMADKGFVIRDLLTF